MSFDITDLTPEQQDALEADMSDFFSNFLTDEEMDERGQ